MDYTRLVIEHRKNINDLKTKLETIKQPSQRLELLRDIIYELQFNQPVIAKDYAEELLDLGLQSRNEQNLGIAYNVFAFAEIQKGDFRRAKLYCYQALDILEEQSEPFIITCRNLAEINTNQGSYDKALEYLLASRTVQEDLKITHHSAFTSIQIAKVYYRKGKYKEAFDTCLQTLRSFQNNNPIDGWEASTYHVMGLIYAAQKEFQLSLDNYLKSANIWEQLGNSYQTTGLYSNIGGIYIYQNNLISADKYFQKALRIDKEHGGNIKMQSLIYQNLAIVNYRSKKNGKAISYYNTALNLCKMINDQLGEMQLLFNMASMYEDDPKKSIELLENSLKIATEIQDTRFMMINYENLSEDYAQLKNFETAYELKLKAQNLERELFGMEKTKAIKDVENQFKERWRTKEIEILKNRNEELKHFVHRAALEVKEPLRLMNSFGNILTNRYAQELDKKGLEYLNFITHSSNNLSDKVDNLIKYAIVGIEAQTHKVDLNNCVKNVLTQFESSINNSKVNVSLTTLPIIYNDKKLIELLLFHLIDNAIKFNKSQEPSIEISTQEEDEDLIISIRDNGIGIAPDNHERIFKIFERVHAKKDYKGDGIGLAICKKIMDTLQGDIWIDSKLNHGTNIFLKFRPIVNPIIT